jgi:ATP-dependent Clp protease ATP-binding subunit ClpX
MEKTIAQRMRTSNIGFSAKVENTIEESFELLKNVEPEDLLRYGLIPEIVGRLPVVAPLEELSDEAMLSILQEPKNAIIKQYQKLFSMEHVVLEFEDEALKYIVSKAKERKTGARALRSIVEENMLEVMFQLPEKSGIKKCLITKEYLLGNAEPEYEMKEAS